MTHAPGAHTETPPTGPDSAADRRFVHALLVVGGLTTSGFTGGLALVLGLTAESHDTADAFLGMSTFAVLTAAAAQMFLASVAPERRSVDWFAWSVLPAYGAGAAALGYGAHRLGLDAALAGAGATGALVGAFALGRRASLRVWAGADRKRRPDACARCGYTLRGLDGRACPECGWGRR